MPKPRSDNLLIGVGLRVALQRPTEPVVEQFRQGVPIRPLGHGTQHPGAYRTALAPSQQGHDTRLHGTGGVRCLPETLHVGSRRVSHLAPRRAAGVQGSGLRDVRKQLL